MNTFENIESCLRKCTKYPTTLSFIVTLGIAGGGIIDHSFFLKKEPEKPTIFLPIIQIYNQPIEALAPSVIKFMPSQFREYQFGLNSTFIMASGNFHLYT